jgi:hypothetical protein
MLVPCINDSRLYIRDHCASCTGRFIPYPVQKLSIVKMTERGAGEYGGSFWRRKIRTLTKRMDVDGDGFVTEKDFIAMGDKYEKLAGGKTPQTEEFREGFRQVNHLI